MLFDVTSAQDLLSKDPKSRLDLKENIDTGVYVKDLNSFVVKSAVEINQVMGSTACDLLAFSHHVGPAVDRSCKPGTKIGLSGRRT